MKYRGSCFLLLFLTMLTMLHWSAGTAAAGTVEEGLFQEGNEAYSRGDYAGAIDKYQQIITTAGYSPGVLYNLANSYELSGRTGRAILNYERALRLAPSDSDIAGNLELVRKDHGLFPKESSPIERFFGLLPLGQWSALIPLSLLLFTVFLLAGMRYRFSRPTTIGVGTCCLLILVLALAGTIDRDHYFNPSVVVSPEAKLFISPFASAASIGAVQEGRLVYPQKSHGEFSYVTDETDRSGWIHDSMIESVSGETGSGS